MNTNAVSLRHLAITFSLATPVLGLPSHSYGADQESVLQRHDAQKVAVELATNFAEAFYKLDPAQAIADVHPAVSKLGIHQNFANSGQSVLQRLTPGTLTAVAKTLNGDGHIDPETAETKVQLLDAQSDVVVFKLEAANDWFDYFLATKVNDKWVLLNCVYGGYGQRESADPARDRAEVELVAHNLASAIANGDEAELQRIVHLDYERRSKSVVSDREVVIPEFRDTMSASISLAKFGGPLSVEFLGATEVTAAVKLSGSSHREWVFMLKLDGEWRPVNSYWDAQG